MMSKEFGIDTVENKIYYGDYNYKKRTWKRTIDVTDRVVTAVFKWFIGHMDGNMSYSITVDDLDYELVMVRKRHA